MKIEKDIAKILLEGWADEISRRDLDHVHVMVSAYLANTSLEAIEASLQLLYHSRENQFEFEHRFPHNRNIRSSLQEQPTSLNWKHKYTITPEDLSCVEIAHIEFSRGIFGIKFKIDTNVFKARSKE